MDTHNIPYTYENEMSQYLLISLLHLDTYATSVKSFIIASQYLLISLLHLDSPTDFLGKFGMSQYLLISLLHLDFSWFSPHSEDWTVSIPANQSASFG